LVIDGVDMYRIILASASPRRKMLLKQLGLDFDVIPSSIDESFDAASDPVRLAMDLSARKAREVLGKADKNSLIIAADTLVVKDGILGKPRDSDEARSMLARISGSWHQVVTGITVVKYDDEERFVTDFESTRVKMKSFGKDTIEAYVKSGECMGKAGAYAIQGLGSVLVERIEGCYFNVVGLPISKLVDILNTLGINIFNCRKL